MYLWSIYDKTGKHTQLGKDSLLKRVVLGKLDSYVSKNEIRTFLHTVYKNKLKMV